MKNILVVTAVLFFGVEVFCQAGPVVADPTVTDVLLKAFDLVHSWNVVGVWTGVIALLKLLIDGLKATGVWNKIPAALQSYTVLFVSFVTVGLTVLAEKGTIQMALVAAFTSSACAMMFHELLDDALGALKVYLEKKKTETPPAA